MLKKVLSLTAAFVAGIALVNAQAPVSFVNPMIGASTSTAAAGVYHGLGKTFPGAATPFGMVQVSPNTVTGGDNASGYSYEHTSIEGFVLTQMSGVGWFGDLGNFLIMPTTGALKTSAGTLQHPQGGYRSGYVKESEKASAGYYSVKLDNKIQAEMTAATHSGILKFTFPQNKQSRIQIDLARRVGGTSTEQYVKVINDHAIEGWMKCMPDGGGWGNGDGQANFTVYFHAEFSKPLKSYGFWSADIPADWPRKRDDVTSEKYQARVAAAQIIKGKKQLQGKQLGFFTEFPTATNEVVLVKTGISFVSIDGARNNLKSEISNWDFAAVHQQAVRSWNDALSKISVEGGSKEEKTVFYTAMYHSMLDPRTMQDADGRYPGGDGIAKQPVGFTKRTIFSGWDVFRSQMPLQTIINPALVNDMINSLVTLADEKGKNYLERWELLNAYSGCMLGNPAVSVIADAYAKGIRGFDLKKAYELSRNSVEKFGNGDTGYTPGGLSLSYTLEYAYTDWCAAQLAKAVGNNADYEKYTRRSRAFRNVFDSQKGWFRPKEQNGQWMAWPNSGRLKQWYGCIESNPYQQGWFVPHDVDGMVNLMGGNAKVAADLEHFFEKAPQDMMWNDYYNHANEPVHHVPYLFNRVGTPWLTQKWTRAICKRAYHNSVEGLVGNEDVGQMSAWYILSAIGLHPVCPGDTRQEITSPVFSNISIKLDPQYAKGKSFNITAVNNSDKNIYIQSAELNGKAYNKCYLDYSDISAGGTLKLVMGDKPSKTWCLVN
ncbi:glycoside hydrolase family 92 protein [Mucilaginibacter pallidiroseus]|uniref:Glycoside hydrolase family 92 protein n=1 Tax=Mucilaginibacter pallidiroseus TaxID=2599295 RepID=A0A563U1S7_9SPHI|nr:GH92 family glycosyl hydrolase [Mucilaginibacter pallidiroseus]TWR24811.1 glycoside hydrolase family 92 protein [Mucilaginibacter pallidiroseus]